MALTPALDRIGLNNQQKGFWGVDVVETCDPEGFKKLINWEALKNARPQDAVFEVVCGPR